MINPESSIDFIMKEPEVSIDDDQVIHNKNSRKNTIKLTRSQYEETSMVWKLSRFLRKEEFNNIDFQYISSSTQLSNGLSYEPVLSLLNSKTVFENYIPQENDSLSIRLEYKHPEINKKSRPYIGNYISFIYSHEWVVNKGFDHIDREYETLYEGEVKIS